MSEIVVKSNAGIIEVNFEEMRQRILSQLEEYRGLRFTEDTNTSAKKTVAELRKAQKEVAAVAKKVKAEYMIPLDRFLVQMNELSDLYNEPINFINDQIEIFEEARKEEKRGKILEIYTEIIGDMSDLIPLDRIYNSKWENATVKEKEIREDILQIRVNAKAALTTIASMQTDVEDQAVEIYLDGFDLARAITYITEYENHKREILQREHEKELEKVRAQERERIQAEQEIIAEAQSEVIESLTPEAGGVESNYIYSIMLSEDAKKKLELYMDSVGIIYEEM